MGLAENTKLALKFALKLTVSTYFGITLMVVFGIIAFCLTYRSSEKSIVTAIIKSIFFSFVGTYTLILAFFASLMNDNSMRFIAVSIPVIIFFIEKALSQIAKRLCKRKTCHREERM